MAQSPLYAGFDLGTTNSAVAVFDGEHTQVVRNASGGAVTPSVVRIDRSGRVTIGQRARRFLEDDPDNTATEWKRVMGTDRAIEFPAAGVRKRPEELSAEILRALRADVADQLGVTVERAVISVPALFELPQSAATSEAARLAGFQRVELLQEPIASALAAGWRADDDGTASWLVYDLGGGTFDASLLETRDGLLRVVGHDGDNFLGGRDFDWAITEHLAAALAQATGVALERRNPAHGPALRLLRLAAEEAKIELSRSASAQVTLARPLEVDGREVEVDLTLTRATVETLTAPLVERSLEVCLRLLGGHGLGPGRLARIVLVGGPTLMPGLRALVQARLEAAAVEGLDPMTLVAQGAALYAATAGLDGRAAPPPVASGVKVWLQYPPVTADLTPHVVGRFVGGAPPARIRLERTDGGWASPDAAIAPDGGFVTMAALVPRAASTFRLIATAADGATVAVEPGTITIVAGLTISDPPLSRTIGVALASDHVQVYFERGAPLPTRRSFTHTTVETIAAGNPDAVLRIPIVQGEFDQAHLCRLVGALEVRGGDVRATVPIGSTVEVTIELDRAGCLSARAHVPAIDQVFEHVAHLLVPDAAPAALDAALADQRRHLMAVRTDAFRHGLAAVIEKLGAVEALLAAAERDIDAAHGGDADAGQKARRTLLEIDAVLAEADLARSWPELDGEAQQAAIIANGAVASFGTDAERRLLDEVLTALARARRDRDVAELGRQLLLVRRLSSAAWNRNPDAWTYHLEDAASSIHEASDLPKARALVEAGRAAVTAGDTDAVRRAVKQIWALLPVDAAARQKGHDSGVR
ncbi:MAG: Hsp70 family protein [Myxococcales bacterium]|nr:Hsp70 family protein [Myxococcales bacterium]